MVDLSTGGGIMKFCPKCGGLMTPLRRGGRTILKCIRCNYEQELTASVRREYTASITTDKSLRVVTTSKISEPSKRELRSKEELEQEREEFYEIALELMSSEELGEEEGGEY